MQEYDRLIKAAEQNPLIKGMLVGAAKDWADAVAKMPEPKGVPIVSPELMRAAAKLIKEALGEGDD